MLDQFSDKPKESAWIGLKVLIGAAACMLLSFGLCGIGVGIHLGKGVGVLQFLGFCLFGISVLGFVVGGIITVIEIILIISRGN